MKQKWITLVWIFGGGSQSSCPLGSQWGEVHTLKTTQPFPSDAGVRLRTKVNQQSSNLAQMSEWQFFCYFFFSLSIKFLLCFHTLDQLGCLNGVGFCWNLKLALLPNPKITSNYFIVIKMEVLWWHLKCGISFIPQDNSL